MAYVIFLEIFCGSTPSKRLQLLLLPIDACQGLRGSLQGVRARPSNIAPGAACVGASLLLQWP